jgi:hypothetical protein
LVTLITNKIKVGWSDRHHAAAINFKQQPRFCWANSIKIYWCLNCNYYARLLSTSTVVTSLQTSAVVISLKLILKTLNSQVFFKKNVALQVVKNL